MYCSIGQIDNRELPVVDCDHVDNGEERVVIASVRRVAALELAIAEEHEQTEQVVHNHKDKEQRDEVRVDQKVYDLQHVCHLRERRQRNGGAEWRARAREFAACVAHIHAIEIHCYFLANK